MMTLAQAVRIAEEHAQKNDVSVIDECFKSHDGWRFEFGPIGDYKSPIPGGDSLFVSRDGSFEMLSYEMPDDYDTNGEYVDITEYLKTA